MVFRWFEGVRGYSAAAGRLGIAAFRSDECCDSLESKALAKALFLSTSLLRWAMDEGRCGLFVGDRFVTLGFARCDCE